MSDAVPEPAAAGSEAMAEEQALLAALGETGVERRVAEIKALLAGMAAAPEPRDAEGALTLIADPLPDALAAPALALSRRLRQAYADQTAAAPAPKERLDRLRAELETQGLDGFVIPRSDEHQGEYVPPGGCRLAWLTGFSGSAGVAVVLRDRAAIFVDGRYTLQARQQVDTDFFTPLHLVDTPPHTWLAETLPAGARLGYDPWLHTQADAERLAKACADAGAELVACDENPVDRVWREQPPRPLSQVRPQAIEHAGEAAAEKRSRLAKDLAKAKVDAAVITDPSSIAWLLNVRGADVAHTPLPLSFALLHADASVNLFIDEHKLTATTREHLGNAVRVHAPEALGAALDALGAEGRRVRVDPASAAAWFFQRLESAGARVDQGPDPCALPKARKNAVEIDGARAAHRRDGAALCRFLAWLAREAPGGHIDEIAAADRLAGYRAENPLFQDLSFDTISGAGPNGAIVHYRVTPESSRPLEPGALYLVDSGAQYLDGTTDVTRTVAIGAPGAEQRARFTAVLKGHIALATTRFPEGTTGSQLDTLARHALWQLGLDYDHGTGHGVGSYLGVHEGPQRISKVPNTIALEPGMIVSNEPGYYKEGAYGIRIENLVTVVRAGGGDGAERPLLGFETLTLAPIDRTLVEPSLLTEAEIAWLNAYHARVRETLTPLLDEETAAWLREATRPLAP